MAKAQRREGLQSKGHAAEERAGADFSLVFILKSVKSL